MIIRGITLFLALSAGVLSVSSSESEGSTPEHWRIALSRTASGYLASTDTPSDGNNTPGLRERLASKASSAAGYVANGFSTVSSSLNDSFGRGSTPPTPIKRSHSTSSLEAFLSPQKKDGETKEFIQGLFTTELPDDLAKFVMTHPTIAAAIAAACFVYKDADIEKKHPTLNLATVRKYIEDLGFKIEELAHDAILLTRETAEGIKEAWFSVKGTYSLRSALTSIGIVAHSTQTDYDQALREIIPNLDIPKKVASTLSHVNYWAHQIPQSLSLYEQEAVHNFVATIFLATQACAILSKMVFLHNIMKYGYGSINLMKSIYLTLYMFGIHSIYYDHYFMTMLAALSIGTAAVLHTNVIPRIFYHLRYRGHLTRLYGTFGEKVSDLKKGGYKIYFSGHSSGGHVAQVLGLLFGEQAFSFNAPGGSLRHARWIHAFLDLSSPTPTARQFEDSILSVVSAGDPISALQHGDDPVHPIEVNLNGEVGLDAHSILPRFWECQQARMSSVN